MFKNLVMLAVAVGISASATVAAVARLDVREKRAYLCGLAEGYPNHFDAIASTDPEFAPTCARIKDALNAVPRL